MSKQFFTPREIGNEIINSGVVKSSVSPLKTMVLAFLAGSFIAFAAQGSNLAVHTIHSIGIAKLVAGSLFSTGLIMVVLAGGELFTGNCLMIVAYLSKKILIRDVLQNWILVYIGNFVGSLAIAGIIIVSGQLDFNAGLLGGFTIKVATYKVSKSFVNMLAMGIMCNWLVCVAVWMAYGAKDVIGKTFAIFFPIWLFIASGFEHCIANMYYIPAGILAKSNPIWLKKAFELGVDADSLSSLNWSSFIFRNLIPVTLGNLIGGIVFVGIAYWYSLIYKEDLS